MSTWHNIDEINNLPIGTRKVIEIDNTSILLCNVEDNYYAIRNLCTHENYPLAEGEIEDSVIRCPLHGATFCLKTGEAKSAPAFVNVETYPTRIEKGIIQIFM